MKYVTAEVCGCKKRKHIAAHSKQEQRGGYRPCASLTPEKGTAKGKEHLLPRRQQRCEGPDQQRSVEVQISTHLRTAQIHIKLSKGYSTQEG